MVLNAAVQMLREADLLKEKILKFKSGTSMLQERGLWATQQELQKVYQKVLVLDLDYALDKKVEQDLWNVGFKQQIEALQAISKDRKNPLRSEGQAMLSWVLQAAAGFYLCLLHQICSTFKLDLPFRRRASLLGLVSCWGASDSGRAAPAAPPAAARYITQHCLVHLGDLARYRHQLRVAHTFYRHAVWVSAHCGQPYNQLALVSWRGGRRLAALYWHARSLLVRAPFPPAPANLARTLAAAAAHAGDSGGQPVLPGVAAPGPGRPACVAAPARLDARSYVTELIRAMNMIHNCDDLDTATALVKTLNSALIGLVATDSFESMTLIKMACVEMWLVAAAGAEALCAEEAAAAAAARALAHGALLALLLPACTQRTMPLAAMPAVKVWLCWAGAPRWSPPAALPAALAHALSLLAAAHQHFDPAPYEGIPLSEDEELVGFLPLEESFKSLRFSDHAAWDTYGGRVPDTTHIDELSSDMRAPSLTKDRDLENKVRVHRILALGKQLADKYPDLLTYTTEDGLLKFTAKPASEEQLLATVASLQPPADHGPGAAPDDSEPEDHELEDDLLTLPLVISESDFREKVIEKRVGILKPQGSLERAREERAILANSQEEPEVPETIGENIEEKDKKEARKPRVNIAMAAIMRKQEETSKQVKFITPPPTPEDQESTKDVEKPKIIQPKPIKSLANLPLGRKTGGILSLKDKSAGYPHLVNTEPEPAKKMDKDEKKEIKQAPGPSQSSQTNYLQKRPDIPPPNPWNTSIPPPMYNEGPRMNFHKNYGIQTNVNYNPNYQPPVSGQGIRLPVVNPKEIDVRTAALQKQNSRPEMFQDGHKFGNNYSMSVDKKNFLSDLPPRFANQYRYWQTAQDNQFNDNKFKDDKPGGSLFVQSRGWADAAYAPAPAPAPAPAWWKPDAAPAPAPAFRPNYPPPMHNYYSPVIHPNVSNPYQNFAQIPAQQKKPENVITPPTYMSNMQPALQNLQNMVSSQSFNSSLGGFGSFPPPVSYDAAMYPQFNNYPANPHVLDKSYQPGKEQMDMGGLSYRSNAMDAQLRNINYGDASGEGPPKTTDQLSSVEGEVGGGSSNTYSLFSAATEMPPWASSPSHPHQSLWCGPGPSPLERLLEQQKQIKQPPAPQ